MYTNFRGIEHGNAQDVAIARGTGTDNFGEERHAQPHDLTRLATPEGFALLHLLLAERHVVGALHHLAHRGVVITGIVLPPERGVIRELLAPDEILQAQLCGVHTELLRQDVHATLDGIRGFGDPQRATVGDASRRFVGVDAVDYGMGDGKVVRTRDDGEETGREPAWISARVEAAVISKHVDAKARDLAFLGRRNLRRHVIVAGE